MSTPSATSRDGLKVQPAKIPDEARVNRHRRQAAAGGRGPDPHRDCAQTWRIDGHRARRGQDPGTRFDAESTRVLTETHLAGSRLRRAKLGVQLLDIAEDRLNRVIDADAIDGKNFILTAAVALDKLAALEGREREDHDRAEREERVPRFLRDLEAIGL